MHDTESCWACKRMEHILSQPRHEVQGTRQCSVYSTTSLQNDLQVAIVLLTFLLQMGPSITF